MDMFERVNQAISDANRARAGTVPLYASAKLREFARNPTPETAAILEKIISGLNTHLELARINAFRFNPLTILWPNKAKATPEQFLSALQQREAMIQQLAKDGIAVYLILAPNGEAYGLNMEDLKGRTHSLLRVTPKKPGFFPATFDTPKGKIEIPVLDGRNWSAIQTCLPKDGADKLEAALKQLLIVQPPPLDQVAQLNPLWYCAKEGLRHSIDHSRALPIIAGAMTLSTHAQLNKIDHSIITYLSNAARRGPTQKTLISIYKDLIPSKMTVDVNTLKSEVERVTRDATKGQCTPNIPVEWLKAAAEQVTSPDGVRIQYIINAVMRSGALLDPNPSVRKRHNSITMDAQGSAPKTHSRREVSNTPTVTDSPDIFAAMKSTFDEYHTTLTAQQLSRKFLDIAHPYGLLPMSEEDINSVQRIVTSMKHSPSQAKHGILWLMDMVKEKQLAMIERTEDVAPVAATPEVAPGMKRGR